ncbi:MAG TPA: gliding motility-associated C-terminal domain-containing protein, partial [Saprospiraceae bacterium]|nr:gliding motility-associated C-terminal domain-containing protein [Saprospiraceae bacterium]
VDSVRCFGEMNGSITLTTADTTLLFSLNEANFSTRLNFPNLPAADYTIYSQDVYGCIDTLPLSVGQPPQRLISLPADTAIILGDSLQIEVQTSGFAPARYIWNDTTYLSCSDCPNPVASPLTSYLYRLTVADENGCQASDEFLLTVQRIIQAYVPNIINLNSQQDANRRFTLNFGPAVRKVNLLQIFDRWGNMVHEVHNALPEDTTNAWEGTHDGKLALPGVYVWILELELVDGTVEKMRGDVTVLR